MLHKLDFSLNKNKRQFTAAEVLYLLSLLLYTATAVFIAVNYLLAGKFLYALLGPISLLFLLLPWLVKKLLHFQLTHAITSCVHIFCFSAFQLGVALRWYDKFWYYDILIHIFSGIFFTFFALCLFPAQSKTCKKREQQVFFQMCYAIFFSMFIAAMWEIGEFTAYLLTGHDMQHNLDTGVFDTMEDLLCCLSGSLLLLTDFALRFKRRIKTPISGMLPKLDALNCFPMDAGQNTIDTAKK